MILIKTNGTDFLGKSANGDKWFDDNSCVCEDLHGIDVGIVKQLQQENISCTYIECWSQFKTKDISSRVHGGEAASKGTH